MAGGFLRNLLFGQANPDAVNRIRSGDPFSEEEQQNQRLYERAIAANQLLTPTQIETPPEPGYLNDISEVPLLKLPGRWGARFMNARRHEAIKGPVPKSYWGQ